MRTAGASAGTALAISAEGAGEREEIVVALLPPVLVCSSCMAVLKPSYD